MHLTVKTRNFLNILHTVYPQLIRAAVVKIWQRRALSPHRIHSAHLLLDSINFNQDC